MGMGYSFTTAPILLTGTLRLAATLFSLFVAIMASAQNQFVPIPSKWDAELLNIELYNVEIEAMSLVTAWQEIVTKYLLRSCLYCDAHSDSDLSHFAFRSKAATGKEVFDAFFAAFPSYTFSQDQETGIIWIHRKTVRYNDILNEKVRIDSTVWQLPMYSGVLVPMCRLLSPRVTAAFFGSPFAISTFNYCVNLSAGTYSTRDILNLCCVSDPTKSFYVSLTRMGAYSIKPVNLLYMNPLVPPRTAALKFWNMEVGADGAEVPSIGAIGAAMSDPNPRKRWAALSYLKATPVSYRRRDLINKTANANNVIWAALGLKTIEASYGDFPYLSSKGRVMEVFTNDQARLDPGAVMLTSMELAREKQDPSLMDRLRGQNLSEAQLASFKPELIRIARDSKLVRDTLLKMDITIGDLSPRRFQELAKTNVFIVVPPLMK